MLTLTTALLVLVPLLMLQIGIFVNMPLLQGYPDLVLLAVLAWALQPQVRSAWPWALVGGLLMTLVSAVPPGIYLLAYTLALGFILLLRRIVWRVPFLMMWTVTILSTFLTHGLILLVLQIEGRNLPIGFALQNITLPSVFYNLVMALPIYALVSEIAKWLHPQELVHES